MSTTSEHKTLSRLMKCPQDWSDRQVETPFLSLYILTMLDLRDTSVEMYSLNLPRPIPSMDIHVWSETANKVHG